VARREPAGHDAVDVVEGDVAKGRSARGQHPVEQAPAPELHHAAAGDGVGREGVRRKRGAVDEHDVVASAGEQQGSRGPGAAGADHDDVVPLGRVGGGAHRQVSCPAGEAHQRLPHDDDPAPVLALGACVESTWRRATWIEPTFLPIETATGTRLDNPLRDAIEGRPPPAAP
jgi:hypothetical protein